MIGRLRLRSTFTDITFLLLVSNSSQAPRLGMNFAVAGLSARRRVDLSSEVK